LPFLLLTFLGDEGFYLIFLPLIYWCVDKRTGARLTFLFLLSAYVNASAKELVDQPRPFEYDPRVKALVKAEGGGLPSGHTQHAVVVWGYLAMRSGRLGSWALAVLLMIAVPLSRLYLGVHFPTDLLGGYILGILLLILYGRLGARLEAVLAARGLVWRLGIAILLPTLLILPLPSGEKSGLSALATLMGIGVGMALEQQWVGFGSGGPGWRRIFRLLIGLAVSVGLWLGLKTAFEALEPEPLFRFIRYGLLGLWTALGAPWVFGVLGLAETKR
jgi:hypothetical protein